MLVMAACTLLALSEALLAAPASPMPTFPAIDGAAAVGRPMGANAPIGSASPMPPAPLVAGGGTKPPPGAAKAGAAMCVEAPITVVTACG